MATVLALVPVHPVAAAIQPAPPSTSPSPTATPVTTPGPVGSAPVLPADAPGSLERTLAVREAKRTGVSVEVVGLRDERSETVANPDGSFTQRQHIDPVRVRKGDGWVSPDETLAQTAQGLVPNATSVVTAIAAAPQQLLSVDLPGGPVKVGWSTALPAASVFAATAVFSHAGPAGADLLATATQQGGRFDLKLSSKPSGALPELRLPLTLPVGTTAAQASPDDAIIFSRGGSPVGYVSQPLAYDSTPGVGGAPSDYHQMHLRLEGTGSNLTAVVGADDAWLQDPARQYPVMIDPSLAAFGASADTFINKTNPNTIYGQSPAMFSGTGGSWSASRALVRFDVSSLRSHPDWNIKAASMKLYAYDAAGCNDNTAPTLYAFTPTNGWDETSTWNDSRSGVHGYDLGGSQVQTSNFMAGGGCAQWQYFDVGGPVNSWAHTAATNNGFLLRVSDADENNTGSYRRWYTRDNNGANPELDVTYNVATNVGQADVAPKVGGYLTSGNPMLSVQTYDSDSPTLNVDFWVYANNEGLAGQQVFYGRASGVPANQRAALQVPGQYLQPNGTYVWKARASDEYGESYSETSGPPFTVDAGPPSQPKITSILRENDWVRTNTADGQHLSYADFWATSGDDYSNNLQYAFSTDGGPYTAWQSSTAFRWWTIAAGWHTLTAKARDDVGNEGAVQTFSFGVGTGSVGASRTWKNLILIPTASSDKTGVTYNWRRWGSADAFSQVPPPNTRTISNSPAGGAAIAGWPVARAGSDFPRLAWDAAATLGGGFGGLIEVQACYTAPGVSQQCSSQPVQLDRSAFGTSYATSAVGPGTLSLATGDLDVSAPDVSVPGLTNNLTFGREHTTLHPAGVLRGEQLTANQQDVESGTAGFGAAGVNLGSNTNVAISGTHSLAVTADGSSTDDFAYVGGDAGGMQLGMLAGHRYSFNYHLFSGADGPPVSVAASSGRAMRAVFFWYADGGYHELSGPAPTSKDAWLTEALTFTVPAGAGQAFIRLYNGTTAGTVYYDGMSLRESDQDLTNATSILGTGWKAELPGPGVGAASSTIDDQTAGTGDLSIVDGNGARSTYTLDGQAGQACHCDYYGVGEAAYDGSTVTKEADGTVHLKEADGTETVWRANAGGYQLDHVSSVGQHTTVTYAYDNTGRITDALAPTATGLTCTLATVRTGVSPRGAGTSRSVTARTPPPPRVARAAPGAPTPGCSTMSPTGPVTNRPAAARSAPPRSPLRPTSTTTSGTCVARPTPG